ncbi:hypothetical protein [Mycetocola saprophilus]|uniref:hypothetical protein n=1 Tax=Mycetocola saprophilus TaxID=76636 RepID=UPI003BF231C1
MSKEHRFWLGIDDESGKHFVSIPVTNGLVDYVEYYELSLERYRYYLEDPIRALSFVEECRAQQHDDLLLQKPGWNRGVPI